jgi:hypothetical protein
VLDALIDRADFSEEEAEATLRLLLEEKSEARIAAFLVLLRAKGETYEEVRVYVMCVGSVCEGVKFLYWTRLTFVSGCSDCGIGQGDAELLRPGRRDGRRR